MAADSHLPTDASRHPVSPPPATADGRPIVVHKYGGSSVADVDKLRAVARKVVAAKEAGRHVVVVVSAMGNTTDDLLGLARQLAPEPDRRELDMLLSVGERISMTLLSMGIHALGHEAISFTGSQVGIITNDAHSSARIIDVRPFRIQDELARERIVIVAGYQGTSYKREVTTLGRGGSDMTAVALAGALGAEACEIYSDVDGVYSSDPRVVLDAARLDAITADEMLELARHGARVLHADAVAWAKRHRIALYARSTHAAQSKGTVIRPDGWPADVLSDSDVAPRAVASLDGLLHVEGPIYDERRDGGLAERGAGRGDADPDGAGEPGALGVDGGTHALLAAAPGLALLWTRWTQRDGAWWADVGVDTTNCSAERGRVAERLRALGATVHDARANVTLVGQDIGRSGLWEARLVAELEAAGVEVRAVGSHASAVTALVDAAAREEAMRVAHRLVVPFARANG